jgi:hypothetical protein
MEEAFILSALGGMLKYTDLRLAYADWNDNLQDVSTDRLKRTKQFYFRRERFVIEKFGSIEAYVNWYCENENTSK